MTPDSLSQTLSDFLDGARAAVVVEDGAIVFNLAESKYSISGEYNKCLLHLWSSERNFVRRVLDVEVKSTTLRLQVQRMGQTRPTRLDFCRDRDLRSPAARRAARVAYEPRLRRAVERNFPGWTVVRLTTSIDLEHSFGPSYLRGWLRKGQRALAVVGVNEQETQSTIDNALTCGILWLDACRLAQQDRRVVEGLVADRAERHGCPHQATNGASPSHDREMAFVRVRSTGGFAGSGRPRRLRQPGNPARALY